MLVTIEYLPPFEDVAGRAREVRQVEPGTTIERLVEVLVSERGERFRRGVCQDGQPGRYLCSFVVNGHVVPPSTVLGDGDTLTFLVIPGGG